ncbi:ferredoxin reductase [Marinobacter sp. C2H3]|uniref:ferredoxin reductase n=1 Tax=Marinobacter sp. C2H3 TaxID=3119003 RepID=UPI00300ECEA1
MLSQQTPRRALHWLGQQLANQSQPAAWLDPLLASINPLWVQAYTPARLEQIIDETHDTRTFVLRPARRWAGFRAGQHVTLGVDIDGTRHQRTFSLSSTPERWAREGRVTLTIKRLPGGRVTNWLHDQARPGQLLALGDAFGDFLLPNASRPLLYIAGGSGITPILSQLATLAARPATERPRATLLYFVRSREDVIAHQALDAIAQQLPQLTLTIIATDTGGEPRFLRGEDLDTVPGLANREVYLCGPKGLMDLANQQLDDRKVPAGQRHSTFFSAPAPATLDASDLGGDVTFGRSDTRVSTEGDATLLEIAEAAGLSPRHGCRMGICHQCSCRKTEGTVVNRLTGEVSSPGEDTIQLCISVPRGPVTVDV